LEIQLAKILNEEEIRIVCPSFLIFS